MKPETQKTERDWQFTDRAKKIGRRVVRGSLGLALTGTLALGINHVANGEGEGKVVPTQTDIAEFGDNLWNMTDEVKNVEDRRDVIDWVEDNNESLDDGLQPGDKVDIPVDADDIK